MTQSTMTAQRRRIFSCFAGKEYAIRGELLEASGSPDYGLAAVLTKMAELGWLKLQWKRESESQIGGKRISGAWITAQGRDASDADKYAELPVAVRREYRPSVMLCVREMAICYHGPKCANGDICKAARNAEKCTR